LNTEIGNYRGAFLSDACKNSRKISLSYFNGISGISEGIGAKTGARAGARFRPSAELSTGRQENSTKKHL
jgi:hypothetical protein